MLRWQELVEDYDDFYNQNTAQDKLRKRCKKRRKKLTRVSFMYVCVDGNGEILVFSPF